MRTVRENAEVLKSRRSRMFNQGWQLGVHRWLATNELRGHASETCRRINGSAPIRKS
jgi:hypothetical protein